MTIQLDLFEVSKEQEDNKSLLTPRQWALWRLVEHNSLVEHRKTTQREIYEQLQDYGYVWNEEESCHDHCVAIWKDIKDNNESLEHNKIIISKNFEYWIGSEEETNEFMDNLWKALEPRLTRYWNYYKKLKRNGQGKLLSNQLEPIDEDSKAELFFQCFNDYNITKQLNEREVKKDERN